MTLHYKNICKTMLTATLLGAVAIAPTITTAHADSSSHRREWRNHHDRRDYRTFEGTVTRVRSGDSFDIRANGRTYNVYVERRLPRRLDNGDRVRVYGYRFGNNDIRNANVTIVRGDHRWDHGNRGRYGDYQRRDYRTFTGRVEYVRSNGEFDLRSNNQTYNVYIRGRAPRRLDRGDTVRVYGYRFGNNDIRNANVTIVRKNKRGGILGGILGGIFGNNNKSDHNYRTWYGTVKDVQGRDKVDVRIDGRTYNVYTKDRLPRSLNRNDRIRIYGYRYGNNDIRNANVRIVRNR